MDPKKPLLLLAQTAGAVRAKKEWLDAHPRRNHIIIGSVIALLVLFALIRVVFNSVPFFVPKVNYQAVYVLVNDKISQHGGIIVNLPKGEAVQGAMEKVSFEPQIAGKWVDSTLPNALVYKPTEALALGKHYSVSYKAAAGTITKDFLVDVDPAVDTVFPSDNAEAPLSSAITIVFNRPMVPLTTLSELESKDIPVELSPATPGKWKWITTRTLQFIPRVSLYGSAHYSVRVKQGFVSVDGLAVAPKDYGFTTTQLRLMNTNAGTIGYEEPITFHFNQAVDLQKTTPQIHLAATAGGSIDFVASYGTKQVWDSSANKYRAVEDTSTITILPKNALRGHANAWEFETSYTAAIGSVYPVGGDIALSGALGAPATTATITTTPVLRSVTAESKSTPLASQDLFDPAGTAVFSFYEDIDIGKSSIHAKGLKGVAYGKKCADEDQNIAYTDTCKTVDDKEQLILTFDPSALERGEQIPVAFDSLVNASGYQINSKSIQETLSVYPSLKILSSKPANGANAGSISNLVLCTNVPLREQDAKTFYQNWKVDKYIVFGRWNSAYLEAKNSYEKQPPCAVGTYVNTIRYGLLPLQQYTLSASLTDVFGQGASLQLSMRTEAAPKFYLRLHNMQQIYNVTTPDKTKLTYGAENFDHVDVYICKISSEQMVRYLATQPQSITTSGNGSLPCIGSKSDRIQLKSDQWVNQYFQIDLKQYFPDPRGQYVISLSNPQYTDSRGAQQYSHTYLSVTNIAVVDNRVNWSSFDTQSDVPNLTPSDLRGSVYWISRIGSLNPLSGARIAVFKSTDLNRNQAPLTLAHTGATGVNGIAEFPLIADVSGATITMGDESAVVSRWSDTLANGWVSTSQDDRLYMYTDRPIYRPGQQVFIKGIYRVNYDGLFQVYSGNAIKLEVHDSRGNTLLTQNLPVSAYGTFSTSLTLPPDAPLGGYYISTRNGYADFDVEEYQASAFDAQATTDKEEYIAGETAQVGISGKYYFGVPLDGGTLDYTVTAQNFYFDRYTDSYFSFGSYWYDCYDCGYGDAYLKNGTAALDDDGQAEVSLPLDFGALFQGSDADSSKIFVFHGKIKDKQGKSVSFQKSFIVHRGEYYLGVVTDPYFVAANRPVKLMLKTVDMQGKSVGESNITVVVNKVGWENADRQEVDGGFYGRSTRTLTPVDTKHVSTDFAGNFSTSITLRDPGEYEIDASGTDSKGNPIKSQSSLYVYGQGQVAVQETNNATLNLRAEKADVSVGDMAKVIIQNPYPHAKALISIERGRIFSYQVVDITESMYEYTFPITEDYVPNVFASVILLSPDPAVKYGQAEFTVNKKQKELTIDVQTDQKSYLPGQTVNLTVHTTNSAGAPVSADLSLAVADLSVLALKGNPKKDPLVFFYGNFPLTVTAETNVKNLLEEVPIPTGTKGGGGANPQDLATHARGEFKDTAFWQASLITDETGVAHVSFKLPDNLTSWQIESLGVTKDTKVGVSYDTILAQKDVMAVPIVPRFVVPGDELYLGAKVFNQTAVSQTLDISLTSDTLTLEDTTHTTKAIAPGETTTLYFKVKVPLAKIDGSHSVTFSAKNASYNDTATETFPVVRNETYESTATAGSSAEASATEYLYLPPDTLTDRGSLTIHTSATLAVYLSDALRYLFQYPFGCSEQLASKLSAIAITKHALSIPNVGSSFTLPTIKFGDQEYTVDKAVSIGLAQVYANQNADGGFAYYKGLPSDPYLTASVLNTFADLKTAGYSVQQGAVDNAASYLYSKIPTFRKNSDSNSIILAAYTLSRIDVGTARETSLANEALSFATTAFMSDKASSNILARFALLAVRSGASTSVKDEIFSALENRVDIDSRGAYVKTQPETMGYRYYETPETDTALLIKALAADKRDYQETPNLIRWLVASRSQDGSWGSTNTSLNAIDALADYLSWKRETESEFTLKTLLDGAEQNSTAFTKKNILQTITTFMPMNKISQGTIHALVFEKSNGNDLPNTFYYDMSLKYYLPVDHIAPRDEGIAITRDLHSLADPNGTEPLASAKVGDVVRGVVTIISPKERRLVAVDVPIPAGMELVNFNLSTEDQAIEAQAVGYAPTSTAPALSAGKSTHSPLASLFANVRSLLAAAGIFAQSPSDTGAAAQPISYQTLYPDFRELHDDRVFLFIENLPPGTYQYEYYLRATVPGTFSHLPAMASEMYFPENFGRTAGSTFIVSR